MGELVGRLVGYLEGCAVGKRVGRFVGYLVGEVVGNGVGARVARHRCVMWGAVHPYVHMNPERQSQPHLLSLIL